MSITAGSILPLNIQLFDGATGKFCRANIYKPDSTEISGSPFTLTHLSNGLYVNYLNAVMPDVEFVSVKYRVYDDAGFTTPSAIHADAVETFVREDASTSSSGGSDALVGSVLDLSSIAGIVNSTT